MAKIKLSKVEIEKMLKDQLGCKAVKWDPKGNAEVELDLDEIKKKEKIVEKIIERPCPYPYYYPYVYWHNTPVTNTPHWRITTGSQSGTTSLCYNAAVR